MNNPEVISVNISEKKGTIKHPVEEITVNGTGVKDDAHSGDWHRQVSMLAMESVEKFSKEAKRKINFGEFAENITTQGIDLPKCHVFDRFRIGETELELTQIGKECHGASCAIFKEVGNCVMPKEGIFCRVLKPGKIKPGDRIVHIPKVLRVSIITLSDRASGGTYQDRSGPKIKEMLNSFFLEKNRRFEIDNVLIPDDADALRKLLVQHENTAADFFSPPGEPESGRGISPLKRFPACLTNNSPESWN